MHAPRLAVMALLVAGLPLAATRAGQPGTAPVAAAAPGGTPAPRVAPEAAPAPVPGIVAAPGAPADAVPADEAHREATALFEMTGGNVMASKMLDLMRGQISGALAQHGATPDSASHIFDDVLMPEFKARLSELRPAMIEIWADTYTLEELRGLHAFYDTPLGRKVLEKQPMVAQRAIAVGAAWGRRVAQDALERHADELRKRGVKL